MDLEIDLGQAILALSDALDLVGVAQVGHGKRVACMAVRCGRELGLTGAALDDVFRAGLLHDCGVSSTFVHRSLVGELDWKGSQSHCITGAALLDRFPPLAHLAPAVRYHHTHWDVLSGLPLPAETARMANLIFLTDRVDALTAEHYERDLLFARHAVLDTVKRLSGTMFAPDLVRAFLECSKNEAFWLTLEPRHLTRFIAERGHIASLAPITFGELRSLALIFAQIVDAKSAFTMEHSIGTARLARFLGEVVHLPAPTVDKLEVAALLHDLGKLQVPDEILEKPGSLTPEERSVIQRHSFETYQILRGIPGLEDITTWAAFHHEWPSGEGYPFHRRGAELTVEMRIVAVADVFQALAQRRPYRRPMAPAEILSTMRSFVDVGHLDAELVKIVVDNSEGAYEAATGGAVLNAADVAARV